MADKNKFIDMMIAGIVERYEPKNEEIIHSGLFLLSTQDQDFSLSDWQYNGVSVISEKVSSRMKYLFKNNLVSFGDEGSYSISSTDKFSPQEFSEIKNILNQKLSKYSSSSQLLNAALIEFEKKRGKKAN
ncbi:MAG: hypothetical protein ACTSQE_02415 [Candidatus Heimdallarchaeaceae archaeon]